MMTMTIKKLIEEKEAQIRQLQKEIEELRNTAHNTIDLDCRLDEFEDALPLGVRLHLHRADINTVGKLLTFSEEDILKIQYIGFHNLGVIKDWLEKHGLQLPKN